MCRRVFGRSVEVLAVQWGLTASPEFRFFIWIVTLLLLSHRAVLEISEDRGEWAACMHKGVCFILCISGGKGKRE